jgi:hypothetical protein
MAFIRTLIQHLDTSFMEGVVWIFGTLCRAGKRKWRNNPKTQQQIPPPPTCSMKIYSPSSLSFFCYFNPVVISTSFFKWLAAFFFSFFFLPIFTKKLAGSILRNLSHSISNANHEVASSAPIFSTQLHQETEGSFLSFTFRVFVFLQKKQRKKEFLLFSYATVII